jgi:hypothetical protein
MSMEQPSRPAGVLGGDQLNFPEDSQRAECDVLQVADGGADDV